MGYSGNSQRNTSRNSTVNIILLLIVSLASFIVAEQIITGWLALAERINISRRDYNAIEIAAIIMAVTWGLITLRTAWGFLRQEAMPSVRSYFEDRVSMPPGILLSVALFSILGIICLVLAEQILTGWLPLGERANISRRDINSLEWFAIIGSAFWGIVALRTVWGFLVRDRRAWAWGQWVMLINALIGLIILMSGLFDISKVIPPRGSLFDNLPGVQELTAPALLIFLSCLVAYRYLTVELDGTTVKQPIRGTAGERAMARVVGHTNVPADQMIRNRLSKSPGAGAIVGFFALFIIFSVASDLFLEPRALAGALSTNITRGIVAIGITMLMISGEFDLSVGSLMGVSGLTFLGLVTGQLPLGIPPMGPIPAAIFALIFTGLLGALNGYILIRTGIPSFIVTLGTLLAFRAIPLVLVAEGRILRYADFFNTPPHIYISPWLIIIGSAALIVVIGLIARSIVPNLWTGFQDHVDKRKTEPGDFDDLFVALSFLSFLITLIAAVGAILMLLAAVVSQFGQMGTMLEVSFFDLMNGRIESLPIIGAFPREINLRVGVFWWFLLVLVFQFILNQTRYGNGTFAAGGNPGAARAQGINVNRIKVTNFIICSVLVGVAAIFDVSRVQSVDALRGQGLELEVIAASVIGGALLTGGYGSIVGALLGVFIFGMLQTGLVLVGMNPRIFNGVIGVIIIVAVVINTVSRQAKT